MSNKQFLVVKIRLQQPKPGKKQHSLDKGQ